MDVLDINVYTESLVVNIFPSDPTRLSFIVKSINMYERESNEKNLCHVWPVICD